jgi:hypothetical protein
MYRIFAFTLVMLSVSSSSCTFVTGKRVRGNGNITDREHTVSDFTDVEVHGAIDLRIAQGERRPVRVEADENLQSQITVETRGNTLYIATQKGYNLRPSRKIVVYLTAPRYGHLEVSGACNMYGDGELTQDVPLSMKVSGSGDIRMQVDAPRVTVKISGAGDLDMKGRTRDLEIDISGAGDAKCYGLLAENTKVSISGAGSAEVFASVALNARVSGAGSVTYRADASSVEQKVSGAGSVRKAD